jgi:hypothetical protein
VPVTIALLGDLDPRFVTHRVLKAAHACRARTIATVGRLARAGSAAAIPAAKITVLADGSGAYPRRSPHQRTHRRLGLRERHATLARERPPVRRAVEPPELIIQSARHDPQIVFARHDHAYDDEQASRLALLGIPAGDLPSRIDATETQIENAGVNLLSYIGPGDDHTVLTDGPFYTETVNGETLVDWVRRLTEGKPVDDVHCQQCRVG